jgi:hypothetical protein
MTDEEMAEEYADEKCKDCYMCSYSEHKNPYKICQRRKDRKQAFLTGLKAGRPQWHYPSKGEYPEKGKEILLYTKILGLIFGEFCEGYNNLWTSNRCDFTTEEIIAWIEKEKILPKESE